MSIELYLILQAVILICYASWIAYRVGRSHGERDVYEIVQANQKRAGIFK